jgi:ribosomal protein S18 acetylase RimI-like enzyme
VNEVLRRARESLRYGGARHLLRRAAQPVYLEWLELERAIAPEEAPPDDDPRVRFADLTGADPRRFAGSHIAPETAAERLAAGHLCFAMLLDEMPAAVVWGRTDAAWLPFLRRNVPLGAGEVYLYDSTTHPAHRRQGLARRRRAHTYTALAERGFRTARIYVLAGNGPGLAAAQAAGFEIVARRRRVHAGPLGLG